MEILLYIALFILVNMIIYDKYVQRKHQLLINYPVIGRMRYFFEASKRTISDNILEMKNFMNQKIKLTGYTKQQMT